MKSAIIRIVFILLFSWLSMFSAFGDKAEKPWLYKISQKGQMYEGKGISWILDKSDSCQFVLFGEQHGVQGVAEFVNFINKQLNKKGFNFLALETDRWTARKCKDLGVREFVRKYPHSIAFDSDADLQLMLSAIGSHPELDRPIWGLDQMQIAIHPFQRLVELSNTAEQRRVARGLYLKAVLKMGRYTRQNHLTDLDRLEKVFANNSSEEVSQIFNEIRKTMTIFNKWMDPATRQESVTLRENLMKANLDSYLESDMKAKVLFKMGGAHTMYGIGPNGVPTLGDHARKIAHRNKQNTLSVSVRRYSADNTIISETDFGDDFILLLLTKEFIKANNALPTEDFSQVDAVIFFKDAGYAPHTIVKGFDENFQNQFIRKLLPLAISILSCLVILMSEGVIAFRAKSKQKIRLVIQGFFTLVLLLTLVVVQIGIIMKYPEFKATLAHPATPFLIHTFFGSAVFVMFIQTFRLRQSKSSSLRFGFFYAIFLIALVVACYSLYYWNIGGMIA